MATPALTSKKLSSLVLKAVLSVYFVTTLAVTSLQLATEYDHTKNDITQELAGLENIFTEPLTAALWASTIPQVKALASGIAKLPIITGVEIINEDSGLNVNKFITKKSDFFHQFQLFYTFEKQSVYMATVTFYSDPSTVFNRIRVGFILLIAQVLIISAVMTGLFIFAIKKYLKIPLLQFVDEVKNTTDTNKEYKHLGNLE